VCKSSPINGSFRQLCGAIDRRLLVAHGTIHCDYAWPNVLCKETVNHACDATPPRATTSGMRWKRTDTHGSPASAVLSSQPELTDNGHSVQDTAIFRFVLGPAQYYALYVRCKT
jgi:hypothetical protein